MKRRQNGCNNRRKHFGVNLEEALEDGAASSQELGEEDLNNIVEEDNALYNVL